jgi:4-alpha-glucanotransferase
MRFHRSSGLLLHPTSLPGPFGIGDLGPEATRFIDFLAEAGQRLWQVLPLGPTGYGDSPYQCFSALAGNPLLISPRRLEDEGWLTAKDLAGVPRFPEDEVDFAAVIPWKMGLLTAAAARFFESAGTPARDRFDSFCARHAAWLDDFALFMALKEAHGGAMWTRWDPGARDREPRVLAGWREKLRRRVETHKFLQFAFFEQWREVHGYCRERNVRVMGDLPIYVSHDSADVWANRRYFELDPEGGPVVVAGVPPDYFSATGQLWGNPIYRWDVLAKDGYRWWLDRFRAVLDMVDLLRLDHFRGFEAYWEVPASEKTSVHGRWVKGPGPALFQAARDVLGVITPEVEAIRSQFGFPGMSILQFAFGNDPQAPGFRPHNYPRELVAYTGTHDCDTTVGWWTSTGRGESTRTADDIRREREFATRYLHSDGQAMNWVFIRTLEASVADTVLIPLQDVLGLGSEARMNQPATLGGNWRWRCRPEALTPEIGRSLREMAELYGRA